AGGATEKIWSSLALEFAARGHEVTIFSRRWPGFANEELISGVRHVRLPGRTHTLQLWRNLLRDFFWSQRLSRLLPPADIAIVNCVALPLCLGRFRPDAGRVVLHAGRMPKGQFRFYRRIAACSPPARRCRKKSRRKIPASPGSRGPWAIPSPGANSKKRPPRGCRRCRSRSATSDGCTARKA